MPVRAPSVRAGRHTARSGRVTAIRRPAAALTLTVNIPLTDEALSPQAHRLIEAVRELVEAGHGAVTVAPGKPETAAAETYDGPEIRLLTASRQVLVDGRLLPL